MATGGERVRRDGLSIEARTAGVDRLLHLGARACRGLVGHLQPAWRVRVRLVCGAWPSPRLVCVGRGVRRPELSRL